MTHQPIPVAALVAVLAAPIAAQTCLSTTFAGTTTTTSGSAALFDLTVNSTIEIQTLEAHFENASLGQPAGIEVWITPTTWVGKDADQSQWTMVGIDDGMAISAGGGAPTPITLAAPITLLPGSYGVSLIAGGGWSHRYSNLGGTMMTYSDSNISMTLGAIDGIPWTGTNLIRVWNGTICYTQPTGLVPGFTADKSSVGPGGSVTFTNTSTTGVTGGLILEDWDFTGDNVPDATGSMVTWTYPAGSGACGPQDVTLIVADSVSGPVNFTQTGFVSIEVPATDFVATPSTGLAPLAVSFTDTSLNDPTAWQWDLDGDGSVDSTAQNPSFSYSAGVHEITLTTFNACGQGTTTTKTVVATSGLANYVPGSFGPFGAGCGPVVGVELTLTVSQIPVDGVSFSFDASNVPNTSTLGAILLGAAPRDLPLDILGASGCSLYVDPFISFGLPLTAPTGTVSVTPAIGTSTNRGGFHAQAAVIAPAANTFGVVFSNRLSFEVGSDVSGISDPSTLPGIVVHFEGTNTFNPAAPFFNVYNNSTTGESITSLTVDFFDGGPLVGGGVSVFDIDGLTNGFEFNEGNASTLDPTCPPNSYNGTDLTTGLVYAGTDPAGCDPMMLGATTGWVGSNFNGDNPATVRFAFTGFGPSGTFQFDADIDGGPLGADGLHECLVTIGTTAGAYQAMLVNVDGDTSFQTFGL